MRRRAAPQMDANKGGVVGTGKATGKQRGKYRNERIFRLDFKRSIIRRYKHSILY
jgi:hypothetical protein